MSVDLLHFLEGLVPHLKWSFALEMLWHVACISCHAALFVYIDGFMSPDEFVVFNLKTTESPMESLNLQIWQLGLLQSGALRLAKSAT